MVCERERRTVFENSDTDWHLYPALEGSLDGKRSLPLILPPGLPSPPSVLKPVLWGPPSLQGLPGRLSFLLPAAAEGGEPGPFYSMLSWAVRGGREFKKVSGSAFQN